MNHVYRLLWSQVTNTWVAVAETARGPGKGSGHQRRKLVAAALALDPVTFASPFAQVGPTGGQVVSGSGTITQSGALTTIKQNSQNLSLNWNTFNIAQAPLTATLTNSGVTKTYDGTTNAPISFTPTCSFSGLVSGDSAATTISATGSASFSVAGSKPVEVVVNTTITIAPGVELHLVKGGIRLPDNLVSVNQ